MLERQNMKINVRSKSLVNIVLLLLCMEGTLCCCKIYRQLRDESDVLSVNNCDDTGNTFIINGRCRCGPDVGSIVSTKAGDISCFKNGEIDESKNT